MKKNLKWIFLAILIIFIVITVVLFINYIRSDNNNNNNDNNNDNILSEIYDKNWYLLETTISNDIDILYKSKSNGNIYIVIKNLVIEYCDSENNECREEKYTYNNEMISIEGNDTLGKGDYLVDIAEDNLKLSRKVNGRTITYYFETAKG